MSLLARLHRSSAEPDATPHPAEPGPIGLDIGTTHLHLCQLRPREDRRYTIQAKYSQPFDGERQQLIEDPRRFRQLIRDVLRHKPFVGRRVCACVPAEQLRILPISYKAQSARPERDILEQVEQRLKRKASELVVDYLPLRQHSADDEHLVLASAVDREHVDSLLGLLDQAGLDPVALDIGPAAIKRLVSVLNQQQKGPAHALVVNTGSRKSYITFVSGRRLLLDQAVDFSSQALLDELSAELQLPPGKVLELIRQHGLDPRRAAMAGSAEIAATLREIVKPAFLRLNEEIQRVLLYTAAETRGQGLSRLDLLGSVARWPGAWQLLVDLLGLELPDPEEDFRHSFVDDDDHTEPWINQLSEMAIATGLALRGIDGE